MIRLFILFIFCLSLFDHADAGYNFDLTKYNIKKINIRGLNNNLDLKPNSKNSSFLLEAPTSMFKVTIKEGELTIVDLRLLSATVSLQETGVTYPLRIEAQPVPTVVTGQNVRIEAKDWSDHLSAFMNQGFLSAEKKSQLSLNMIQGDVELKDFKGNVDIEIGQGNFRAKDSEISGMLKVYKGNITTQDIKSEKLMIQAFESQTKLDSWNGDLAVDQKSGSIKVVDYLGVGKYIIAKASSDISFLPKSSIHLTVENASTVLRGPKQKNVRLNLKTESGEITLPGSLQAQIENQGAAYVGLIEGEAEKSEVRVRSTEGRIVFKLKD